MEAAPRLDGCADDDELGAVLRGDARDVLPEAPRPGTDDLAPHADAVGACHGGRRLEPLLQAGQLPVETRVERQLALDDERSDENDACAAVGREAAGEVECVPRELCVEQRDDDHPLESNEATSRATEATAPASDGLPREETP